MKRSIPYHILVAVFLFAGAVAYLAIRDNRKGIEPGRVNPAFRQYIPAFTAGMISSKSVIRIRLAEEYADSALAGKPAGEDIFSFEPAIHGSAIWTDSRTITFTPSEPLPQDHHYRATFKLGVIIPVPDSLALFRFGFSTMPQLIAVEVENHTAVSPSDLSLEYLTGVLTTSDETSDAGIEKVLMVEQGGGRLPVTWTHDRASREHRFRVEQVKRGKDQEKVELSWDGEAIGSESSGEATVEIPALGDFNVTHIRSVAGEQPYINVYFSDPLDPAMNFDGLFKVGRYSGLRYTVEENILRIYFPATDEMNVRLSVEPTVRNVMKSTLGKRYSSAISLEDTRPGLRFPGDGVILPSSNGMLLPFEAVHLKAVDIRVVRVYEQNILQFLQINDLPGTNELARVGRIVLQKTMPLTATTGRGKWTRYTLDLSTLINAEPGAIYSVILGFKQAYSTYPCGGQATVATNPEELTVISDPDEMNNREWGYYSNYFDNDYDDGGWVQYRWDERDDPCKSSYYYNKSISRNILASDLGLSAKAGNDGKWHVFVTDIVSARPLEGVAVQWFNFQLQQLSTVKTDANGYAVAENLRNPFALVARYGNQTGYLKLTDGRSLSLSMFDVGGEPVQKGLKGFIYGDRGVWRPGDSIFLTFILEDKLKQLPLGHPVSFTLSNPSGQVVNRTVRTQGVNGFYHFAPVTPKEAPTGNWTARVNVGNAVFSKMLKIETVKPNRLKININFGKDRLVRDHIPPLELKATWLTGINAGNLKARVMLTLTKAAAAFDGYPGYIFDNPYIGFSPENVTLFDGDLDASGGVVLRPQIHSTRIAPGALKASFETTVFEKGGDFSIDRFSIPFYPYATYAGLRIPEPEKSDRVLYTDKSYPVDLMNVDADGKPVTSGWLKVEVYKLEWRWWWDNAGDGEADFISTSYHRPQDSATLQTSGGKARYIFTAAHDDWGRYLIKVTDRASGHVAAKVVYVDWPGYFRMPGGEKQAAAMLTLTTDKPKYKPGEKIRLTLPSSPDGRALVTVENGAGVVKSMWVATQQGSTDVVIEATPDMAPNCYLFVSLLQPHAQTKNDLPVRLYGVIPVPVEDPSTHLDPVISMPGELSPGEKAVIRVKEATGRPMTYTLAMVDEGLLDITRFKTPDPWNAFYTREALGVKTWDLYDMVIGAYSGELQRILSIGGDEEEIERGGLKANRFKPMVKFLGPFTLKKGEQSSHSILMPEYIGSVRVMVVAGKDGSYGNEEKTVPVKKALMVLGTLPRVLGPGETFELPVTVFAMDSKIRNAKVEVITDDFIKVTGSPVTQVTFGAPGDKVVSFSCRVAAKTGIARIRMVATSGNERAENTIEIGIRNPNRRITNVSEKALSPGEHWSVSVLAPGIPGSNKGVLELSSIPPVNLDQRMGDLIHYPYGCTEQTVSAAFPQLFLPLLTDAGESTKKEIERNILAAIRRVQSCQVSNGGISYWPGGRYADDWATSYAGHFLLEAAKAGYPVPAGLMQQWREFQKQKAISWVVNAGYFNDELIQSYRLYTLALAGTPEAGAMNRLFEQKYLAPVARWQLAAAYQLAGKKEVALKLVNNASIAVKPYREMGDSYGSDLRDKALIVETLTLLGMQTKALPLVRELAVAMSSRNWYSTQTTAFALLAIARFSGHQENNGINASFAENGGAPTGIASKKPLITREIDVQPGKQGTIKVTNSGKGVLYARMILTGIPAQGDSSSAAENLSVSVTYKSVDGRLINPILLTQGTSFLAEVKISNPGSNGTYKHLALSQVFPSGWEIINARNSDLAQSVAGSDVFDYQDVRDDRVNTFLELAPHQSKRVTVMLMAAWSGRFYLPPVICEAMYDNTIHARVPGRWVEVAPAKR